jgi:hypothetical protein
MSLRLLKVALSPYKTATELLMSGGILNRRVSGIHFVVSATIRIQLIVSSRTPKTIRFADNRC